MIKRMICISNDQDSFALIPLLQTIGKTSTFERFSRKLVVGQLLLIVKHPTIR